MAQVVPLKCPSCGAPLDRESSRCEFCGTELMLVMDGSGFQTRQGPVCSNCGKPLGAGAWLCAKCGTPVPGNEERLRELHMKQQYLQNDARRRAPHLGTLLEPDEYIAFLFVDRRLSYYAVTDKRLLTYTKPGTFSERVSRQYKWSEVAAVGDVVFFNNGFVHFHKLEVQTLNGPCVLSFDDGQSAHRFRREIADALKRHNKGQRDIRALIWSLNTN